jgi:hypothetical protein
VKGFSFFETNPNHNIFCSQISSKLFYKLPVVKHSKKLTGSCLGLDNASTKAGSARLGPTRELVARAARVVNTDILFQMIYIHTDQIKNIMITYGSISITLGPYIISHMLLP